MSESPNAFVGGEPGAHHVLGGLVPGDDGFCDALLAAVPAAAADAVGLYQPVVLEGVSPPQDPPQGPALGPIFDRYNLLVPQANAFFQHLARLDAMNLQLGVRDLGQFADAMVSRLAEAHALLAAHGVAAPTTATTLAADVGALITANHAMMSAYMAYQVALVHAREAPLGADAQATMRGNAQAAHRAFAQVIDTPFAIPGAERATPLVTAGAVDTLRDALGGVAGQLALAGGEAASAARAALDTLLERVDAWRTQAARVQASVVSRRIAARAFGRALDQAKGAGGDRFATVAVVTSQVREALSIGSAVREALPGAATLSGSADALEPIATAVRRYDGIWLKLEGTLGRVEAAAAGVFGPY